MSGLCTFNFHMECVLQSRSKQTDVRFVNAEGLVRMKRSGNLGNRGLKLLDGNYGSCTVRP